MRSPGGKRFDERERAEILFAVHFDESATLGDQLLHRAAQPLGQEAGRVADSDVPARREGPERSGVDGFVPSGLVVDDPDEREML